MKKQAFVIIISFMFLSNTAKGVSLEDALAKFYENNEDIKDVQNKFLGEIELFPQALIGFLPNIEASVSMSNNLSTKYKDAKYKSNNQTLQQGPLQKGINLNQSVFNSGRDVANLKVAQEFLKSYRAEYYASEQKALNEAMKVYLNYYSSKQKYEIAESNVKSGEKHLEAAEQRLKLGEGTKTDVATAKSNLDTAVANKLGAFGQLESSKASFVQKFGVEPEAVTLPEIPNNIPSSLEDLKERSRKNLDIYQVRHKLSANKATEWVARSNLLPSVNLQLNINDTTYENESYSRRFDHRSNVSVSSAVSLNIPIYTKGGADYSKIRQAKNNTRSSAIALDGAQKSILTNCVSSWAQFNSIKSALFARKSSLEAAQLSYDGTVQEQLVGSKSLLDVLNAEGKLNDAKINNVDAEVQYVIAAYQMQTLIGEMTARSMKLNVSKHFNPENEIKKVKFKIIGF